MLRVILGGGTTRGVFGWAPVGVWSVSHLPERAWCVRNDGGGIGDLVLFFESEADGVWTDHLFECKR